jgi:hypothetical protein
MEKEYKELCDWMKRNLGDKVAKVQISKRISSSPCVLVSGKFGWSANMERYARLIYTLICGAKLRVTSFASKLNFSVKGVVGNGSVTKHQEKIGCMDVNCLP